MRTQLKTGAIVLGCLLLGAQFSFARNEVLDELQLEGTTKVEKTSGVDGIDHSSG